MRCRVCGTEMRRDEYGVGWHTTPPGTAAAMDLDHRAVADVDADECASG